MRESKKSSNGKGIKAGSISRYHESTFEELCIFTSDRKKPLSEVSLVKGIGVEWETSLISLARQGLTTSSSEQLGALAATALKYVLQAMPEDFFRMEHDRSISGIECPSQIGTKEFWRNHYGNMKNLYEMAREIGVYPDNDSCGMHINISLGLFGTSVEKWQEPIKKFCYMVNANYDLFRVLFLRTGSTHYCRKMNDTMKYWKECDLSTFDDDHYVCINLAHYHEIDPTARRIELRLPAGCSDFYEFKSTMETVFHIIGRCKSISWNDCTDVVKIFSGCNYCVWRRLEDAKNVGMITDTEWEKITETHTDESYC